MTDICIFSRSFHPAIGGIERLAHVLAMQMSAEGHRVEVVTDTPAADRGSNVAEYPFRVTRTTETIGRIRAFRRAEVVLSMNTSLPGLIAAWLARRPVVVSHQGCYEGRGLRSTFFEKLKRASMAWTHNISCTNFVARHFRAASKLIPNPYDDTLFRPPPGRARERDFVFCGRLVSEKGVDVCIRAFAQTMRHVPEATLTVIGDGPERQDLIDLAGEIGVADSIRFRGALSGLDLVESLGQHACMIVPSVWKEAFGIVVLEGIACCDTVIVARRGGLPEAVGACGIVAEPTVGDLSKWMVEVANARRAGKPLPSQPAPEVRALHLARHSAAGVTRSYLEVLAQAIQRR